MKETVSFARLVVGTRNLGTRTVDTVDGLGSSSHVVSRESEVDSRAEKHLAPRAFRDAAARVATRVRHGEDADDAFAVDGDSEPTVPGSIPTRTSARIVRVRRERVLDGHRQRRHGAHAARVVRERRDQRRLVTRRRFFFFF